MPIADAGALIFTSPVGGSGGGGSGTVSPGTAGQIAIYTGSTTVGSDTKLDDGNTTANTLTYTGTGGITAPTFNATNDPSAYQIASNIVLALPDSDTTSIAVGKGALVAQTHTSSNNTAVGLNAGAALTGTLSIDNTVVGSGALSAGTTNVLANAVFGYQAMASNAGSNNVAVGSGAGATALTVSNSVLVGYDAATSSTADSNEIAIGYGVTGAGTNTGVIGNSSMTDIYFGSSASDAVVHAKSYIGGTDGSVAGTIQLANASASAHTIWGSAATTSNTILGFATVPTTGHLVGVSVSGSVITLTDGGAASAVSSVSGDGTIITNSASTGAVTLTIAGTSGGIPYFSSTTGWASSALLASGGVVLGGGAATAPSTNTHLTFATNTLTIGLAGTGSGILSLAGSSSGSATITAPAVAGTATNPINFSNYVSSGTDNSVAGGFQASNGSSNAHTIWGSAATSSTTILGFATAPTTGHLVGVSVSGSVITLTDGGAAATGTVTSVSFTGGLISVATSTTTPALTVAGTSGGIPYFSSTSAWASSALLASGGVVLGGGSGTAPSTSTQLTFSAPTLTVGLAGTSSGILALTGSTSGNATFTAPATAGTRTNPVISSNYFQIGVAGTTSGELLLAGSTSGTATILAPAVAGTSTNAITISNNVSAPAFVSTVAIGTAPFTVTSTTNVANLNASSLSGATFASPGAIGGTSASTGTFTTVNATTDASAYQIGGNIVLVLPDSDTTSIGVGLNALVAQSSTALHNTAVGHGASSALLDGAFEVAIGDSAGNTHTHGGTSVFIGASANASGNSTTNEIVIGYNATGAGSNTGVIGNSSVTDVYFGSSSSAANVRAAGYYAAGSAGVSAGNFTAVSSITTVKGIVTVLSGTSDERLKNWIPYQGGLAEILAITPAAYYWNEKGHEQTGLSRDQEFVGFIAQDVQKAIPQAITATEKSKDGTETYLSLDDRPILAAATNAIKELHAMIQVLTNRIAKLEARG